MRRLLTLIGALMLLMALAVTASAAEVEDFEFTPTGEIIEVTATANINIRDENYNNPVVIKAGETMWLIGESTDWNNRAVVVWVSQGRVGTVLERYLQPTGRKFTYEETLYYATTTSSLRMRDPDYNPLQLLSKNTSVYVFGNDTERSGRAVILAQNTVGTVLNTCLKKNSTATGTGTGNQTKPVENTQTQTESFIVSTAEFNFRAESETPGKLGELLHPKALPAGTVFLVHGDCPTDSTRLSVSWGNIEGTIMKSSYQKTLEYIPYNKVSTPYPAISHSDTVLLAKDGVTELDKIPQYSIFTIYGIAKNHPNYWVVSWQGQLGMVPMNNTWKVGDAIFIDEETQTVTLYKDSKFIVTAECVTGMDNGISNTPKGRHWVNMMVKDYTLRGVNLNGEPYARPVKYFIAFYGDAGLHDASWRTSFGGNIYKYNGSLMCVNCPLWVIEIIYKNTYDGMMVCVV